MVRGQSEEPAASGYQPAMQPILSSLEETCEWVTLLITTVDLKKSSVFMHRIYNHKNINTYSFR